MSIEENENKVKQFFDSLNHREFDHLKEIFNDKFSYELNTRSGREIRLIDKYISYLKIRYLVQKYSEEITVRYSVSQNNRVIVDTDTAISFMDVNHPSMRQKSAKFRVVYSFEFQNGKITSLSRLDDTLKLSQEMDWLKDIYERKTGNSMDQYLDQLKNQGMIE